MRNSKFKGGWCRIPTKKPQQPVPAMAFLNGAREYADAANELFMVADARTKIHGRRPFENPLYLLCSHAAELALKAFLVAKCIPNPWNHEFAKLYAESRDLGLVIGQRDKFDIEKWSATLSAPARRKAEAGRRRAGSTWGTRRSSRRSSRRKHGGGGLRALLSRHWRKATTSAGRRFRG
jgi:hypothetical protein